LSKEEGEVSRVGPDCFTSTPREKEEFTDTNKGVFGGLVGGFCFCWWGLVGWGVGWGLWVGFCVVFLGVVCGVFFWWDVGSRGKEESSMKKRRE